MKLCDVLLNAHIAVDNSSTCQLFKKGEKFDLQVICGENCIFLLHAVFPYRHTLKRGGYFRWQNPGEGVIAQCASDVPAVEVSTKREGESVISEIFGIKGTCPRGYERGQKINYDEVLCEDLVSLCLPLVLNKYIDKKPFTCRGCEGNQLRGKLNIHGM